MLVKAFIIGGLICVVGQILIDKTKIMSARILVLYVCLGCILGGLGIYMVKKTMDAVSYEYKDGCNILTIKKDLTSS